MAGKLEKAKGMAKETVGGLTGNKDLESEGKIERRAGEAKEKVARAKHKVEEVTEKAERKAERVIDKVAQKAHHK